MGGAREKRLFRWPVRQLRRDRFYGYMRLMWSRACLSGSLPKAPTNAMKGQTIMNDRIVEAIITAFNDELTRQYEEWAREQVENQWNHSDEHATFMTAIEEAKEDDVVDQLYKEMDHAGEAYMEAADWTDYAPKAYAVYDLCRGPGTDEPLGGLGAARARALETLAQLLGWPVVDVIYAESGSAYLTLYGGPHVEIKVRLSDHPFTSRRHEQPDVNIDCSANFGIEDGVAKIEKLLAMTPTEDDE